MPPCDVGPPRPGDGRLFLRSQVRVDDAARFSELKPGKAVVVRYADTALLTVEPGSK